MSSDERSPKRQRLNSYSPASTPTETKSTPFVQHPNTPPPSVHMSPSWNSQTLPGLGMAGNGNGGGVNFPTPPSPAAGYPSQSVAQSVGSDGGSARHTPAAEVDRQDTEMTEREGGSGDGADEDASMAEGDEHRRTDHERTEGGDGVPPLPSAIGLHYLPTQPIARSQPQPSQNLLELYGLQRIQASVARKDPGTGEKINKLRKSYEGKVKDLGLEGRNKANKNLREIENLVDPDWDIAVPDGRTFFEAAREHVDFSEQGTEHLLSMLGSALSMRPGRLPRAEDNQWKNSLGLDDSSLSKAAQTTPAAGSAATTLPAKTAASHFLSKTSPATAVQRSAPASPRGTARPERSGKKRSYHDASFEGYEEDGYSTGDGGSRRGSASKRQKRKDVSNSTSASPPFGGSSGGSSNMVGVRSS